MFLKNQTLSLIRRVRLNLVCKSGVPRHERVLVDHRDLTLGDPRDHHFVVIPDANDRVCRHEETLKAPADDLREAAKLMRASLCYGGSADPFYRTIADWFDREAGQAERRIAPGFPGVADELAVWAARAYLPGARAWLHDNRPCGHANQSRGCGGCDPSAIDYEYGGEA